MNDSTLEDDILWVYHTLPRVRTPDEAALVANPPSSGAVALLAYAVQNPKDFFSRHLEKALKRKEAESTLRDDQRKFHDLFDQLDQQFAEERAAQRQCPYCARPFGHAAVLPNGAKGSAGQRRVSSASAGHGDQEPGHTSAALEHEQS